jgi:serine/threonine protein kinase
LFDLLHNRKEIELSWRPNLKTLADVAKGLNYLHSCKPVIVHRDLKSLNLLLSERIDDEFDKPIMKIADFGMAKSKHLLNTLQRLPTLEHIIGWLPKCSGGLPIMRRWKSTHSGGGCMKCSVGKCHLKKLVLMG